MFTALSTVFEPDVFFTIHPFKKLPGVKPFTMLQAKKRNRVSSTTLYLDHSRKVAYEALSGDISTFTWNGHSLFFIAGIAYTLGDENTKIYTCVHRGRGGAIKVPCCYENPDYMGAKAKTPDEKLQEIKSYLMGYDWRMNTAWAVPETTYGYILDLVLKKLDTDGWSGGKTYG